ncbi:aminoglycoside phosphotransferase family protein [Actinospica durhamensis]|uniref:Aminoglycoside phosphotransferase family protein n=1 Tax=Actinospica durhamensis TaxID=1508375 RepID=A0A941ISE3_9ACTN|nr:aminoglycoside phosphotransferase family protein [Actinospica durhamensis]MBR7838409.1 aminoglycoside phosphotransferase family protein [Actinospica durhamensis]
MHAEVNEKLLVLVEELLPGVGLDGAVGTNGQFHDVVLLPGRAAIRIARSVAAEQELERRTELSRRLAQAGLPFTVPEPLTPVKVLHGRTAVAMSWVEGEARGKGAGDPQIFAGLLRALAEVDCAPLRDVLGEPHEYAGRADWARVLEEQAVPALPRRWRAEARRRVEDALDLPEVEPSLVHGDLCGYNLHWGSAGRVVGVLDWDLAAPFDPAVDAACLGSHGWDAVRAAVPAEVYRRARIWYRTFGIEQVASAILNGEPAPVVKRYVARTAEFLERTAQEAVAA